MTTQDLPPPVLLLFLFCCGCGGEVPVGDTNAASQPGAAWWEQETGVTWSAFGDPAHEKWLDFVEEVGTTICDRGVHYDFSTAPGARARIAEHYHQRGLHLTSFQSIDGWEPEEPRVAELIGQMRRALDDGCDGIHLDMLFSVADPQRNVVQTDAAVRAVARMRDAVHEYPGGPRRMFAGNAWKVDTPFRLQVAKLCDVAWVESWGHDDLDLVRIARVARSLDGYGKPAWYHWQPDDNEQGRVEQLANLPKALYSSCLMEGAVFLCNYQYPVPLVHRDGANREIKQWRMFPINARWRKSVLQYASFVKEHADLWRGAAPRAPVLVAFKADRVQAANRIMRDLLAANVAFNVVVCGTWPLSHLDAKDVEGYHAVATPDPSWAQSAGASRVYDSAAELLATAGPAIRDFCRIEGEHDAVTRVFEKGSHILVHLKQHGYTDDADGVPAIGPLTLTLHCPRTIRSATCLSPDRPGSAELTFRQNGPQARITVPALEYYDLLVFDVEE